MSETLCENCQLAHASRNYLSICNPSVVILKGSDLQARKSGPLSLPKPINLSLLAQPIPREPQEFSKQCRDQNGFTCLRDLPHILHSDYPVIPSASAKISQLLATKRRVVRPRLRSPATPSLRITDLAGGQSTDHRQQLTMTHQDI